MLRHVLAVTLVICLIPSFAAAQNPVLTITAVSADVHVWPSVGSPVVGQAPRGRVLQVARVVGDWVRVAWPGAPGDAAYVRIRLGVLSEAAGSSPDGVVPPSQPPHDVAGPPPDASHVRAQIAAVEHSIFGPENASPEYVIPPRHAIGIGGVMTGSTIGVGGSGRFWSRQRLGVQVELSRYALTPVSTIGRVTSIQFAPSAVYALKNHIRESVRIRPYLGGGVRFSRFTSSFGLAGDAVSANRKSWQAFGGSELTFPAAPRLALSADVRYDSADTPFAGFEFGGLGFAISGHWYVR